MMFGFALDGDLLGEDYELRLDEKLPADHDLADLRRPSEVDPLRLAF